MIRSLWKSTENFLRGCLLLLSAIVVILYGLKVVDFESFLATQLIVISFHLTLIADRLEEER